MNSTRIAVATAAVGLLAATIGYAPPAAAATLADDIADLQVAPEDHTGYDRDLFGDYDRDALLDANFADWPECDGYYSRADDECSEIGGGVSPEEADDNVDVDHLVALAEAWESGASRWSADQRDEYAGATVNLWLMTSGLNRSKGAQDVAEWLPPDPSAVCFYVEQWVTVKLAYELSVDQVELDTLRDLAADCDADGADSGGADDSSDDSADGGAGESADVGSGDGSDDSANGGSDGGSDDSANGGSDGGSDGAEDGGPANGGDAESLPVTGASTGIVIAAAAALLVLGVGLYLVFHRRRVRFTSPR